MPLPLHRILFLFLLATSVCHAQNFGGFPPATKWQQIDTDTARIIFAPAAQEQATRIAQIVHAMAADTPVAITNRSKKINIVLHNNTTQANGYVALGPFRSEFYLIPGSELFDFGTLPWHENLAVHEYRHVQQYNAFNRGLTKLFSALGGQNGRALANALTVPDWFFEGDAVYAETAFTEMGRGRQPFFLSAYNSLWQEGRRYNWMKLRNGSFKDYVPNHYALGYLLVNYGYLKYGADFWRNVTGDASSFYGLVYPFQRAVKQHSHEHFKKFRNDALQFYKKEVPEEKVHTKDETVTNYHFPQAIGADSLLYIKESYRRLPYFVLKTNGKEERIKRRSITTENWFSYNRGRVVYTAFRIDKRWSLIDYSNIVLLDLNTGREKWLTEKAKYYTPDFSPDGTHLVAVSINDSLQTELHLISAANGTLVKRIRSRNGDYFMHPRFVDSAHIVVSVRAADGLLSLQRMNWFTAAAEVLIAPQKSAIGNPSIHGNTLYFTASFAGNDDLYAYRLNERKLFQLTSGKTGNYYTTVQNDSLVWSKFTTMGLQLQQRSMQNMLWKEVPLKAPEAVRVNYPIALTPPNVLLAKARPFDIKNYNKATGLINLHSWDPGLNLYSNNILNTLATSLYYQYNEAEDAHTTGIRAVYGALFPVLSTSVEQTFHRQILRPDSLAIIANESEIRAGFSIPLNFTRGKTFKALNFGSAYVYNAFRPVGESKTIAGKSNSQYLHHFITWTQRLPQARQHIYPRLGYAVALNHRHRIDETSGYQFIGGTAIYLPSFAPNHSLVLTGSFQQVDTANLLFSNRFSLARGYPDYYYARMWNGGFNYHMPLAYPDWGFANLVYLLRLRSAFFVDYSQVRSRLGQTASVRSTGAELYFDTKWWNQLPVSFGVRYSYLLDAQLAPANRRHRFEFIIPIDLIPF